jgi:plastocyanin
MKISNVARLILGVAIFAATGFLGRAESSDSRGSMPLQKKPAAAPIRILDQNGQPAINGVPSATGTIVDVTVAPGGTRTFSPSTVNISVGDTVRWTWAASGHSVTSGDSPSCTADGQFCSPNNTNCSQCVTSNIGFVYEFTFAQAGNFSYHCCVHCALGMIGAVNVSAAENIVLTGRGKIVGGIDTSRLAWTGASASNIDVYRNGTVVATVPNTGSHTDSTGVMGRASFTYMVCDAGTSTCSNTITVRFR